jgi:hypothetical protein
LHLREHAVGRETVIGEYDVLPQALVEDRPSVGGGVVVGKRGFCAGLAVMDGEARDAVDRIDARLGSLQHARVDVRGVDQRSLQETFFAQQYGERIRFLPGAAAGDPDLERRYVRSSGTTCSRTARK